MSDLAIPEDLQHVLNALHERSIIPPHDCLHGCKACFITDSIARSEAELTRVRGELETAQKENAAMKRIYEYVQDGGNTLAFALESATAQAALKDAEAKVLISDQATIINSLWIRLNNRLVDIKPEWDDSLTGFNDALDTVRNAPTDPIVLSRLASVEDNPPAKEAADGK